LRQNPDIRTRLLTLNWLLTPYNANSNECYEFTDDETHAVVDAVCALAVLRLLDLYLENALTLLLSSVPEPASVSELGVSPKDNKEWFDPLYGGRELVIDILARYAGAVSSVDQTLFDRSLTFIALESRTGASAALRASLARRRANSPESEQRLSMFQSAIRSWLARQQWASPSELLKLATNAEDLPPGAAGQRLATDLDITSLRRALPIHEALIVQAFGDEVGVLWVLRPGSFAIVPVESSVSDLKRQVAGLLGNLSQDLPVQVELSHQIYRTVVGPLERWLSDADHLLVVPDPVLGNLPLSALVTEAPKASSWSPHDNWQPAWLIDRFAVTVLPSLDMLVPFRGIPARVAARGTKILGDPVIPGPTDIRADYTTLATDGRARPEALATVFPPLEGVELEMDAVAATAAQPVTIVRLAQFTEASISSDPQIRFRAALFATHAQPATEERPAFLLATPSADPATRGDGLLTADEIATSNLNAEVVVLSACRTGVDLDGSGGFGTLVAAFFATGADAVVATHWPIVSDAARYSAVPLMIHASRSGAAALSRALREVALELIHHPAEARLAHPRYWAAFFVIGAAPND
jgi:CHAT domain-containing protein